MVKRSLARGVGVDAALDRAVEVGAALDGTERGTASESAPTGETRTQLVRRARKIGRVLAHTYPDAHCELDGLYTPLNHVQTTRSETQDGKMSVRRLLPNPQGMLESTRAAGCQETKTKAARMRAGTHEHHLGRL